MQSLFVTSLLFTAPAFGQGLPSLQPLEGIETSSEGVAEVPPLPDGLLQSLGQSLVIDEVGDGVVWASGPRWKASFSGDGFTYIPFLGSDAPRNYPVHFALESVTADGQPVAFDRAPMATRTSERTVTLGRSSVREVYHLGEDSVEQTFVFDARPASGEIVLRMAVNSDLQAQESDLGLVFLGESGGVGYGSATGISATGKRVPLERRFVDGAIEIRVPAEELEAEAFPFVVDPILTTLGATDDARDQVDVDIAYDGNTGVYMIVYEEVQSAMDHDIRSVFYNTGIAQFTDPTTIDITSDHWTQPRVAGSYDHSTFLCVATRGESIGFRDIWGRTRNANTGAKGAPFAISTYAGDNSSPDVGGFGGDIGTGIPFFVVWQNHQAIPDDYDIIGQGVGLNGTLQGPFRAIADSPSEDDMKPRISQSSGSEGLSSPDHQYLIAWERRLDFNDRDIWTRVVHYSGSTTGHSAWRSYSSGNTGNVVASTQSRSVTGHAGEAVYVLAFERLREGTWEVFSVVTREGNPDNARSVTEMQDIAVGRHHRDPKIAQDGTGDYMIAYKSAAEGGGYNAHFTAVNIIPDDGELRTGVAERRDSFAHVNGGAGALAIASTYDGGLTFDDSRAMVLFTSPGSGGDEEVTAAIVAEETVRVDGAQFCHAADNGSGSSAWIRSNGSGNQPGGSVFIQVQDLPLNAFGYVIASLDAGYTMNPGGSAGNLCLSGAIGRYSNQIVSSGSSGVVTVQVSLNLIPQPTGYVSAMSGDAWKFQYWTRDEQGGMPTSNFSNAVVIDFK